MCTTARCDWLVLQNVWTCCRGTPDTRHIAMMCWWPVARTSLCYWRWLFAATSSHSDWWRCQESGSSLCGHNMYLITCKYTNSPNSRCFCPHLNRQCLFGADVQVQRRLVIHTQQRTSIGWLNGCDTANLLQTLLYEVRRNVGRFAKFRYLYS